MTKNEFLRNLQTGLETHQVKNVTDILTDYEEHFTHGLSKGKSEAEIAQSLGSPSTIAQAYKTETMIAEIKNTDNKFRWGLALNIILRLLVLAPFNFFVLLIPGLITFFLLATGWSLSLTFGSIGLGILFYLPSLFSLSSTYWMAMAGIFGTIGFFGLGIIGVLVMFFITKYIVLALIGYLQWNLKFITEK